MREMGKGLMKTFFTLTALFCLLAAKGAQGSEGLEGIVFHIGVSSRALGRINPNDASAALKAWAVMVKKEQKLMGELDVRLLTSSVEEIRDDFLQHKLDGVSITVEELTAMNIQTENVFIGNRKDGPEIRYAIIVHGEGEVRDLCDLMNRKVVTYENGRMILALPWLETLMADHARRQSKQKFESPTIVENPSKAILQVFFHQADAAVVTAEAFDVACELNPQLRKDLKVLCDSPALISAFFMFQPSSGRERNMETVEKAILDLHTTPGGRQVLTVMQSSKMKKHPFSILDNTIQFVKKHQRLTKGPSFLEAQP